MEVASLIVLKKPCMKSYHLKSCVIKFFEEICEEKKNQNFIFEQLRICLIDVTALRQIC